MSKAKRYAAGGMSDEEAKKDIASGFKAEAPEESKAEEKSMSPSSFKEAFAEARKAGDKTFEYNGKKYTTEMAGAKKPATKREAPSEAESTPAKPSVREHLAEEFKKRPAGSGYAESARQARVDKIRRNVGRNMETYGMKKGGTASSRGDGIAQRGKTKGRMV